MNSLLPTTPHSECDKYIQGGSVAPGSNAGLKHFTLRLAEIIEKSRTTTYSDLADTLLADLNTAEVQAEEKNVRRRVYDALNVLEAIGCVQKGSKLIEWIGWPSELNRAGTGLVTGETAVARMFAKRDDMLRRLTSRIERSQEQAVKLLCLCNLIKRNKDAILPLLVNAQRRGFDAPNPFPVPFMMVLAPESAKTDVYISEDARHAEIVFNDGVRYDVYDDCGVLQLMGLGEPSPACLESVLTAEE